MLEIIEDDAMYLPDLVRLNELWINEHFEIEEADRQLAADPSTIIRDGGHSFCALLDGQAVGAAALFRVGPREFELARMTVAPSSRGQGIGRSLAQAALHRAEADGATSVSLGTNTILVAAIALYRSLGFEVVWEGRHPEYSRCNMIMRRTLGGAC